MIHVPEAHKYSMRTFPSPAELSQYFFDLTKSNLSSTILELGAREAVFSKLMAAELPASRVFAFEASPYNYSHFLPQMPPSVTYLNLAVAEHDGEIEFHINEMIDGQPETLYTGRNSIVERVGPTIGSTRIVKSVSVDAFLSTHAPDGRIAMWIDVEGATGNVLRGAVNSLHRVDAIHCEVEEKGYWVDQWLRRDVDRFLAEFGLFPVARDREYGDDQYNVVYARHA